jgi:hypothetical protein
MTTPILAINGVRTDNFEGPCSGGGEGVRNLGFLLALLHQFLQRTLMDLAIRQNSLKLM